MKMTSTRGVLSIAYIAGHDGITRVILTRRPTAGDMPSIDYRARERIDYSRKAGSEWTPTYGNDLRCFCPFVCHGPGRKICSKKTCELLETHLLSEHLDEIESCPRVQYLEPTVVFDDAAHASGGDELAEYRSKVAPVPRLLLVPLKGRDMAAELVDLHQKVDKKRRNQKKAHRYEPVPVPEAVAEATVHAKATCPGEGTPE